MKYGLPENHGLSQLQQTHLLFKDSNGNPALSDAQYEALNAGVGRGESALVVSPTSTGKTQIALWAIAGSLERGCNTVYLVTHRALAKQKFEDFKQQIHQPFLGGSASSLVVATGDYVEDVDGELPAEPLRAPLLVATYEKYLAMLSASGVPRDLGRTVIVCDEIQLLGDEHRGQNVEVLLTLLRNAGWQQFVGLSAVLRERDAADLANWLGVRLVVQHTREKHLRYECWTEDRMLVARSDRAETIDTTSARPAGTDLSVISALMHMLRQKPAPLPVIVFCMRKQDTYDLARAFVDAAYGGSKGQMSLAFDGLPATSANEFLSTILERRVASHNADLTDEERSIIESRLLNGEIDVVFATSTLAAGVNFPLGAAVFSNWTRWDSDKRTHVPIDPGEFHNMAGRVGRMGFAHETGRVVFFASTQHQVTSAQRYLALGELPSLEPRVTPERFNQLALQLVSSGLCTTLSEVQHLICNTFSALREGDRNQTAFRQWPGFIASAHESLLRDGLIVSTTGGRLTATPVGRATGHSGLLPETGVFLLRYMAAKSQSLAPLLPQIGGGGNSSRLSFLLFAACFSAPEFRSQGGIRPTRFLPYPLSDSPLFDPAEFKADLVEPNWFADIAPINAAWLTAEWISGAQIRMLEGLLKSLSAGMLRDMYRNLVWVLDGLAAILTAGCDRRIPPESRPPCLRIGDKELSALATLPRYVKRLGFRVASGLPDDVLWMTALVSPGAAHRLGREEILSLRREGLGTPEMLMLGTREADEKRARAFVHAKPTPLAKSNWVRDACRAWKVTERTRAAERHVRRAKRCAHVSLVERFYRATGNQFEEVFESILAHLQFKFQRLDDKTKTGAPDYVIWLADAPPLVMELKSREEGKLVDYNRAVEVLAASEVHGYRTANCVTLCHPGVDPSVPAVVEACGRLTVVESADLGEALLRCCERALDAGQLYRWLTTPGQALCADLPFSQYG